MSSLRYLLDTNIVSNIARHPKGLAAQRLMIADARHVGVSIVVVCEIRFGLAKRPAPRLKQHLEQLLDDLALLHLEPPVEEHYADIRNTLERAGTPIGPNDLLIAAHARALELTLVTDNLSEFSRVPGLAVENWLLADA
jgi:tRNA(fMet)-specific endonuclease VapC